jgi:hypothetical protein
MRKKLLLFAAFLLLPAALFATDSAHYFDVAFSPSGKPIAGASIRVCTEPATTAPCTPLAVIYSNSELTTPLANPFVSDALGNYEFFAASGEYALEVSSSGYTTAVRHVTLHATVVPVATGGTGQTTAPNNNLLVGTGAGWVPKALSDCVNTDGNHLNYDAATKTFSCGVSGPDEVYVAGVGKQTHHVLSTAANATVTISDKHDPFVASDAGKTIRLILRNAATLEDYETTISSFISATQVVVAAAPTITSTTGEAYWFDAAQNDTAALQNAINTRAGTLRLGKGVYVITGALTNQRATTKILGNGTRRSIILMRKSATSDSFTLTDMMHPTLESFTVVGPGMDETAGGAIRIRHSDFGNVDGLKINDVLVSHVADSGFVITTPILSTIMNSKVLFGAGHGFHIQGGTTTDLINDYAITVVGAGILIEDSAAIMGIQGGATESAGIGVLIKDSYSVSVDHYDTEAQIDRSFAAPAAAPLLSATAGGTVAAGTYYWKFCWMHGVAPGPESAESLQLTVTGAPDQTITANLGTVPANTYVARIYSTLVNGASGSEGFLKDVTGLTPGTTGYATKTSPITVGAVPPTFWYDGHGYVVSNSKKVSVSNSHSRDLPITDSRHYLITDNSSEVSVARPRIVQGTTTPTYDIELTAGAADNELVTNLASTRILNSATNTLIRKGGSLSPAVNTVTFSATPTFDASLGNTQKITLTGNVTSSTLSNATTGQQIDFLICQDGTGSRTFVWPTNVLGGMTIGSTLSKCSAQSFRYDGTLTKAYALGAGATNM